MSVLYKAASQDPTTGRSDSWTLIVAANNDQILRDNLLASPVVNGECQVVPKRGFISASKAYNAGISEAAHEILVFAHQDVFLPPGWTSDLGRALAFLAERDPNWGVLGMVGVARTSQQEVEGYCYSSGLRRFVGQPFPEPIEVESLDEIVLILRRSSGLRFDEQLPGFHLYGTDICLEAKRMNMKSYVASAFCVHNTNGIQYFPQDFWRGYLYLRHKWTAELPIHTCCTTITKWCTPAINVIAREMAHRAFRPRQVGKRWDDVNALLESVRHERETLESTQEQVISPAARNPLGHKEGGASV